MNNLKSLLILFLLLPIFCSAQQSELGNWILLFGNKKINNKFNWHHELQYRNYNVAGDLEQLLLRTGLGYNVQPNANLLLGYGFIRSENYINEDDKIVINEHRIYQQFITKQKIGALGVQHRYRFEQRFVEDDFRTRFRYFLSLNHPIYKIASNNSLLYLSAYNEIFLNNTKTYFDRNRLYGGIGYKLNDMLKFELGYMTQYFNEGRRDQMNLVCFVNW